MTFKIGDFVKCIDDEKSYGQIALNEIYKVLKFSMIGYMQLERKDGTVTTTFFMQYRFILVEDNHLTNSELIIRLVKEFS
jgi:hypothetical protein